MFMGVLKGNIRGCVRKNVEGGVIIMYIIDSFLPAAPSFPHTSATAAPTVAGPHPKSSTLLGRK